MYLTRAGSPCPGEVLSETTENHDRVVRVAHYRHHTSVEAIVLMDSRRRLIELQTRNPNGTWTLEERTAGELPLEVLELVIPFDELYEGVTFPVAAPRRGRRTPRRAAAP